MIGGVHEIAARRAARQMVTVAGGPDLSIKALDLSVKTWGQARIESPLAALLDTGSPPNTMSTRVIGCSSTTS